MKDAGRTDPMMDGYDCSKLYSDKCVRFKTVFSELKQPNKSNYISFQGRLNKSDGFFYEGGWLRGRKHGQGLVIYPNGDCFEGYWRKDLRDGEGKYWIKSRNNDNDTAESTNKNNSRAIKGIWKRDIMKTGIINDIEKIDIGTEASIESKS